MTTVKLFGYDGAGSILNPFSHSLHFLEIHIRGLKNWSSAGFQPENVTAE